jgi:hypothetical protein
MAALTNLERNALEFALSGPENWKLRLRGQIDELKVASREDTGAGIYVNFDRLPAASRVEIPNEAYSKPPTTRAAHSQFPTEIVFLVWLKDGQIDFLEIASGITPLPDHDTYTFKR